MLVAACGGGSSDSGGGMAPAPGPQPVQTKVLAIGDSIGNGFGLAVPWPVRLSNALGVEVNNNSRTNEQTSYGLRIIADRLNAVQPTHVVIMLGTNDAIRGSASAAVSNLQQMVNIANERNVIAIVATLPPITNSNSQNSRAAQISSGIRGLSGAVIADVRAVMPRNTIVDGVHPGAAGQQIIADTFLSKF